MEIKSVLHKSLFSIGIILISGCEGSSESAAAETFLELSVTEIEIPYTGGKQTVSVEAGSEWTAYSDADWILCNVSGSTEKNGTIDIIVDENKNFEARTTDITVKSGTTRKGISVVQEAAPEFDTSDISVPEGYRLVWHDEFNDSKLDSPDESLWYYETGDNGWGNNEIQNYIPGSKNGVTCAEVSDGIFSIIAQKAGDEVYSIRINSKESWKYGYFEARFKLPKFKPLNSDIRIPLAHNNSKIARLRYPAGVSIFTLFNICSTSSVVRNFGNSFGRLGEIIFSAGLFATFCSLCRYL